MKFILTVLFIGLGGWLCCADMIADFNFENSSDLGANALGEGIADISLNPDAAVEKGMLVIKPRAVKALERNVIQFYQGLPEAWKIELELKLDAINRDCYILCSANMFLRYSVAHGTFQFGVLDKNWIEVAAQEHIGVAGKVYALSIAVDGKNLTLSVDGKTYITACTALPRMNTIYLGALGWDNDNKTDFSGGIDNIKVYELEKSDPATAKAPEVKASSLALFCFSGNLNDSVGKGAKIDPGDVAELSDRHSGSLRLVPRRESLQKRCVMKLPESPNGFYLEFDFNMKNNGPIPSRDMMIVCSANFFVRYSVDRFTLEIGLLFPDGWKIAATSRQKINLEMNRWYKVGCQYDGAKLQLYVDDALEGEVSASGKISIAPLTLGGQPPGLTSCVPNSMAILITSITQK
ncbi:MAG: hypothetical protein LBM70_05600 [Victivallales bacterium]|jgi:hypothetical protein|nr:hypothetical protein [Victivallales bacterium]